MARMGASIIGIDPGTIRLGYGVLECGRARPVVRAVGVCRASAGLAVAERLAKLQSQLREVLAKNAAECVVLETSFHGKNAQAMLRLGEARGMVIGLAGQFQLPVVDYSPAMIKKAVTGRGNATKEAVARMVGAMAEGVPPNQISDATDALAVALCHAHRQRLSGILAAGNSRSRGSGSSLS